MQRLMVLLEIEAIKQKQEAGELSFVFVSSFDMYSICTGSLQKYTLEEWCTWMAFIAYSEDDHFGFFDEVAWKNPRMELCFA